MARSTKSFDVDQNEMQFWSYESSEFRIFQPSIKIDTTRGIRTAEDDTETEKQWRRDKNNPKIVIIRFLKDIRSSQSDKLGL